MPTNVIFPKVSLDQETGCIARWLIEEGAVVAIGDILFEVDNDKAAVEVEAPAGGVIRGLVGSGEILSTGDTVAQIYATGEDATEVPVSSGVTIAHAPSNAGVAPPVMEGQRPPNPTPLARKLARDRGISIEGLIGTGPRGRIQKADVLAAAGKSQVAPAVGAPSVSAARILHTAWLRDGDGIPVVMLHGFSGDLNNWRGLWAGGRSRWPALGIDLPGHGQSPRDIPADLDDLAGQVERTLAALDIGPMVLAGHSLGAAVATRLARRSLVDVRGLCLFAPAGLGPEIHAPFVEGVLRAQSAESLRPWLELLVDDPSVISEAFLRAVESQRRDRELTQAMQDFAKRFLPDGTQRFSIAGDLAAIKDLVRIVFGRQDRILPFSATHRLPENVALHAVGDCGHMPHIEKPALCMRILDDVWRSANS